MKIEETVIIPNAVWLTSQEGNGLTSQWLPCSSSSCQPGKEANNSTVINVKGIPVNLDLDQYRRISDARLLTYIRPLNTISSLNLLAIHMRLRGSPALARAVCALTRFARVV